MRGCLRALLAAAAALGLSGCYAYHAALRVAAERPAQFAPRESEELRRLAEAASAWAGELGLAPSADLAWAREHRTPDYPYWPLAGFQGAARRHRAVTLWLEIRDDGSELRCVIRDMDHAGETEFTRRLRERLERELGARFGAERLRLEKTRIGPVFFAG